MISHNAERAGLSPLTHASMCCRATGVDAKTVRRDHPPDNPEVREEMKAIASKRRRFGYRRIGVLLERKGMIMNHKKLYRLYTEEKLGVRRRRGRKRARRVSDTYASGFAPWRALVVGFCVRHVWSFPQIPHPGCE